MVAEAGVGGGGGGDSGGGGLPICQGLVFSRIG